MTASEKLNEAQLLAVNAPTKGVTLVQSLAGTGKTRVLRHRVNKLLEVRNREGHTSSKILVTAYNVSIADELRGYFQEQLSDKDFKRLMVKTSHGVATTMLYRYTKMSEIRAESFEIPKPYHMLQALQDFLIDTSKDYRTHADIRLILELEAEASCKGLPISQVAQADKRSLAAMQLTAAEVAKLALRMRSYRLDKGLLMHQDTVGLANSLPAQCFRGMQFRDVLADEMQDLNFQQRQLISNFMQHAESFTGTYDSRQCLYSWQGADVNVQENLLKQYPEARVIDLTTNYRSTDEILTVANHLLEHEIGSDLRLVGTSRRGLVPSIHTGGAVDLIKHLQGLCSENIDYQNMAILYRTRKDLPQLEAALVSAKIPYALKDSSFFEDVVVQDMAAYLNLLYNPIPEQGDWRRIFNHYPGMGMGTAAYTWTMTKGKPLQVTGLTTTPAPVRKGDGKASWSALVKDLVTLKSMAKDSPVAIVKLLLKKLTPYWEKNLTNGASKGIQERLLIAQTFLAWVENFSGHVTGWDIVKTIDEIERGAHKNKDRSDVLNVMTCHKAKGLQFDCVMLWNAEDGSFPLNGEHNNHEEEKRILYVATTRAKNRLAIFTQGGRSTLAEAIKSSNGFSFATLYPKIDEDPFTRT